MSTTERVLPLLRSGEARESIPPFLPPQLYLDFRKDEAYQDTLELLLRRIFDSPAHARPPLGTAPTFQTTPSCTKWVLVAGSGREDKLDNMIEDTCKLLGSKLAAAGYGLITGGWPGVDRAVARSFSASLYTRDQALERRLLQMVREDWTPAFPGGNIVFVASGKSEWTKPIEHANAVVLIQGFGGTQTTGELATKMGKPVFPLADTGNDALAVYSKLLRDAQKGKATVIQGVTREEFMTLGRPAPSVVDDLMRLLEKVP